MKHLGLLFLGLAALIALSPEAAVSARIELCASPPTLRIRQAQAFAGQPSANIAAARNEYESFQVIVTARGGNLERVDVGVSPLSREDGVRLPEDAVTVFREAYVPVRHTVRRASEAPGLVPDPLVPFVNPYSGAPIRAPRWGGKGLEGARFGAAGFEVWQDRNQALWVDVYVPQDTPAGVYTGAVRVHAPQVEAAEIPVHLTVWDFTLPDGPTHENHFGGFERVAAYQGLDRNSEAYQVVEDRYIEMMAAHRLNPPLPARLRPAPQEDGRVVFGADLDRRMTAFVERHHLSNIEIPRAPFSDLLGADRERAIQFYRSWYAYLEEKGWDAGAYLYMLDEPNDAGAYERVRQLGALVREGEPRIRRLVVEQPYVQDPAWGTLDGAIDIWCPLFGFVHEASVQRVQAQGDSVWSYTALVQPAPRYHPEYERVKGDNPPYWQIDFPVTSYRIAPWLNRRYGITGLLYWSTVYWGSPDRNPWDDPGFRVRWNGDGFLFYPGSDAGVEGPIASMRLKNLRDGMEDYEYFVLLAQRGGGETAGRIVQEAVPTWGSWEQDPYRLLELRRQLAEAIMGARGVSEG